MRILESSFLSPPSTLSFIFLLPSLTSAATYDCKHIRVDGKSFDLSPIGGPHSLKLVDNDHPPGIRITTWSIDICHKLPRINDIPKTDQCEHGTYVCGIEATENEAENTTVVDRVIPIAGSYATTSGRALDPKFTRLKATDPNEEGIQMEIHGGKYAGRNQKAVVKFICDKDRTGNEDKDSTEHKIDERRRALDDDSETEGNNNSSLRFVSYGADDDMDILRLDWNTKYACEGNQKGTGDDSDDDVKSAGWGFFTWFIVIAFLGIAAYLIFGSWLNYNRYGARGWDLLPHSDTIRDMPYILQDWWRKVMDTISGTGSRGGYSAV